MYRFRGIYLTYTATTVQSVHKLNLFRSRETVSTRNVTNRATKHTKEGHWDIVNTQAAVVKILNQE